MIWSLPIEPDCGSITDDEGEIHYPHRLEHPLSCNECGVSTTFGCSECGNPTCVGCSWSKSAEDYLCGKCYLGENECCCCSTPATRQDDNGQWWCRICYEDCRGDDDDDDEPDSS